MVINLIGEIKIAILNAASLSGDRLLATFWIAFMLHFPAKIYQRNQEVYRKASFMVPIKAGSIGFTPFCILIHFCCLQQLWNRKNVKYCFKTPIASVVPNVLLGQMVFLFDVGASSCCQIHVIQPLITGARFRRTSIFTLH